MVAIGLAQFLDDVTRIPKSFILYSLSMTVCILVARDPLRLLIIPLLREEERGEVAC